MFRMLSGLILVLGVMGCQNCQRRESCGRPAGCGEPPAQQQAQNCCGPQQAPAPSSQPAFSPAPGGFSPAPSQYVAQPPLVVSQPQLVAAQPQYVVAQQGFAPQASEAGLAMGMGVLKLPIPFPKFYAVPKPVQTQVVTVQQPAFVAQSQIVAPQSFSPQAVQASPPACPSAGNDQLLALLMAMQQEQARQPAASPPPAPAANQADVEARIRALDEKLDRCAEALNQN